MDADFFEMRNIDGKLIPIACFEVMEIGALFIGQAQRMFPLWEAKIALYLYLKEKLHLPIFIVRHTSDCHLFAVSSLTDTGEETEQTVMDEMEYKTFLEQLQ